MLNTRKITRKDYSSVVSMLEDGRKEGFFAPGKELSADSLDKYLKSGCYEHYQMDVIEYNGILSGFIDYYIYGGVGNILGIYILPERRHEHLGSHLIHMCIIKFEQFGCHKAKATVYSYNNVALSFLEANGFKQLAMIENDEFHKGVVYMYKDLAP